MTRTGASLLGFIVAPVSAGTANVVFALLDRGYPNEPKELLGAFLIASIVSITPMLLLAVPMFLLLNRFGLVNVWTCLTSGALVGAVFGAALRLPNSPQARDVLVIAVIGVVAALAFWLVWRTGQAAEE